PPVRASRDRIPTPSPRTSRSAGRWRRTAGRGATTPTADEPSDPSPLSPRHRPQVHPQLESAESHGGAVEPGAGQQIGDPRVRVRVLVLLDLLGAHEAEAGEHAQDSVGPRGGRGDYVDSARPQY